MGTSFGTYAITIPLAIGITAGYPDPWYGPVLGAAAGGGVFGDHCSPISDTGVGSTATGCDHVGNVRTQLPYAVATAMHAVAGYAGLGLGMGGWPAWAGPVLLLGGLALRPPVPTPKESPKSDA